MIIVYFSRYGHSQRYAEKLASDLNLEAYDLKTAVKRHRGERAVFVSWVCASALSKYKTASENFDIAAIGAVSLMASKEQETAMRKKDDIDSHIRIFDLKGGLDANKLKGKDKLMIKLFAKIIEKGLEKKETPHDEDLKILEVLKNGADFYDEACLLEIESFLRENA